MLQDLLATIRKSTTDADTRMDAADSALSTMTQAHKQAQAQQQPAPVGSGKGASKNDSSVGKIISGGGPRLQSFLKAVSTQESGGNYDAVGVQTAYGTAYGKYQILDSNFVNPGGWDKETLGRDITLKQYRNRPKLQERMAQGKLSQYFKRYGASGAAKAWYAGEGNARTDSDSAQYGGPSINAYAASVLNHMRD